MKHDPFYRKLIEKLNEPLDPDAFEHCAADILRSEWRVVPVRGGQDSGMDGAVADGAGEPFPLVCTTSDDALGNLRKNLDSYMADGGVRREVIFATSRQLTPRRQANLKQGARSMGFTLVQIYEQAAIADRLYRNSKWCRELLGVTGAPPALSAFPLTRRPIIGDAPIGRDDDLAWLRGLRGDALLLGAPGCGKTFLLQLLTKEDSALFVASEDRTLIAESLRDSAPSMLIVDDAHSRLDLLESLIQMRRETGLTFAILATAWPGRRDEVQDALGVPDSAIREIELLTRDEMVQVIRVAGVGGPEPLIREIVDQSAGRPGLAATFAHLCLQGDVRSVVYGEVLARSIGTAFKELVGDEAIPVLAALALGGDAGMSMEAVSGHLGIAPYRVQQVVTDLAAGGVIREISADRLAVQPPALRHSLVRDTFFSGARALRPQPLIELAPDRAEVIKELIGSRSRGACVNGLEEMLAEARMPSLWHSYACLGEAEARFVLREHHEMAVGVAEPALHYAPDAAIPLLLDAASHDSRPLNPYPDHPLRQLADWVRSAVPRRDSPIERRIALAKAVCCWLESGGDKATGVRALVPALSPSFEINSLDPGGGTVVTFTNGTLEPSEMARMGEVWSLAVAAIGGAGTAALRQLVKAVEPYIHPESVGARGASPEVATEMRALAVTMTDDLLPLVDRSNGLKRYLRGMRQAIGLPALPVPDPEYEALFPGYPRRGQDWRTFEATCKGRVQNLAGRWEALGAGEASARLAAFEREAAEAESDDGVPSRWSSLLCEVMARKVGRPASWTAAFIEADVRAESVAPFLGASMQGANDEALDLCALCLSLPQYRGVAIWALIQLPEVPERFMRDFESAVPDYINVVEVACVRNEVSVPTLQILLCHANPRVSGSTAARVWSADPHGEVPAPLAQCWRDAILRSDPDEYLTEDILLADATLAIEWLTGWFGRPGANRYGHRQPSWLATVILGLSAKDRSQLLDSVPHEAAWAHEVVPTIIGRDVALYQSVLKRADLSDFHLPPLGEADDASLLDMVPSTLSAGYTVDQVARSLFPMMHGWSGPESLDADEDVRRFTALAAKCKGDTRRVFEHAAKQATNRRESARKRERYEAVYGRGI